VSAFWGVMRWTGLIVWACLVILAVIVLTRPYRARREQPVPVVFREPAEPCPWCDTRDCVDSTLCRCGEPCGSWLCVVEEPVDG